jgi:hypothetical protein
MVSASFPNRPFDLRTDVWFVQSDIANNRSLVGWQLVIDKRSYSPTHSGGIAHSWMTLSGVYVWNYGGSGFDFRNGSNFLIASGQFWVPHNADGTGAVLVAAAANYDILGATSISGYWVGLPTIPRASNIQFVSPDMHSGVPGQPWNVASNRASANFIHNSDYYFGSIGARALTDWGATATWTPPLSLIEQMPDTTTMVGWMRTYTYSGGTYIGQTEAPFRLTVPASYVPTIGGLTDIEASPGVAANIGRYVKGVSTLALEIVDPQGIAGSTIASQKIEILSGTTVLQTINSGQGTSGILTASGTLTLRATVTDTRGRTATFSKNITVLNWAPPVIASYSVKRALSNATVDEDQGTYFRVNLGASMSSLFNGTQRNSWGWRMYTRLHSGGSWTLRSSGTFTGTSFASYKLFGTFSLTTAYDVLIEVYDEFATSSVIVSVAVAAIFMHWDGSVGVGIGKFREEGRMDIAGDVYIKPDTDAGQDGSLIPAPTGRGVVTDRLPHTGTTAERNAYYGTLTTTAQQVALANRQVVWYNTEKGWFESYYVPTGTASLTARGLVAGHAAGWYPLPGSNLVCTRIKSNDFQPSPAGTLVAPTLINPPLINLGGFTVSGNNVITPPFGGYYDVVAGAYWSGGGPGVYRNIMVDFTSGTYPAITSVRFPNTGADGQGSTSAPSVLFPPGVGAALTVMNAAVDNIYGDGITRRTFLTLKYAGPPLVNG